MTQPVHRENQPPIDLEVVKLRIAERRAHAASPGVSDGVRLAIESDTDLMQELATECRRLRMANKALRDALRPGTP